MSHKINRILCSVGMRGDCSALVKESMILALATGADMHILHVVKSFSEDLLITLRNNIHNPNRIAALLEERTEQWREELEALLVKFWDRFPDLKEAMQDRKITLSVEEGYPASVI